MFDKEPIIPQAEFLTRPHKIVQYFPPSLTDDQNVWVDTLFQDILREINRGLEIPVWTSLSPPEPNAKALRVFPRTHLLELQDDIDHHRSTRRSETPASPRRALNSQLLSNPETTSAPESSRNPTMSTSLSVKQENEDNQSAINSPKLALLNSSVPWLLVSNNSLNYGISSMIPPPSSSNTQSRTYRPNTPIPSIENRFVSPVFGTQSKGSNLNIPLLNYRLAGFPHVTWEMIQIAGSELDAAQQNAMTYPDLLTADNQLRPCPYNEYTALTYKIVFDSARCQRLG